MPNGIGRGRFDMTRQDLDHVVNNAFVERQAEGWFERHVFGKIPQGRGLGRARKGVNEEVLLRLKSKVYDCGLLWRGRKAIEGIGFIAHRSFLSNIF